MKVSSQLQRMVDRVSTCLNCPRASASSGSETTMRMEDTEYSALGESSMASDVPKESKRYQNALKQFDKVLLVQTET